MDWDTYYERFYDWAESTQISRISSLTSFGSSEEVTEVAQAIFNEKASSRLIKKAVAAGVKFSAEEIMDLACSCDDDAMTLMVATSDCRFTREQLDDLALSITEDVLEEAAKRSGVSVGDYENAEDVIEPLIHEEERPRMGLFSALALAMGISGSLAGKAKRHNGRCNGDCANCPPHYGYRYGRWYYGHGHNHGCEFGGNKGGGSMD